MVHCVVGEEVREIALDFSALVTTLIPVFQVAFRIEEPFCFKKMTRQRNEGE